MHGILLSHGMEESWQDDVSLEITQIVGEMKILPTTLKTKSQGIILKKQRENHEKTVKMHNFGLMRNCLHWSKSGAISRNCTMLNIHYIISKARQPKTLAKYNSYRKKDSMQQRNKLVKEWLYFFSSKR